MTAEAIQRLLISVPMPADVKVRNPIHPKQVILLLHGYTHNGNVIYRKCASALPDDAIVLAPNGLFPLPKKIEAEDGTHSEYQLGFTWYFYDPYQDEYFIDLKPATRFLVGLVDALGVGHLPLTIVGFSQGGYLAPFIGQELPNTKQVIGIASDVLIDELGPKYGFQFDGIMGELDEIVEAQNVARSHQKLRLTGVPGELKTVPNVGHRISREVQVVLKELLNSKR